MQVVGQKLFCNESPMSNNLVPKVVDDGDEEIFYYYISRYL